MQKDQISFCILFYCLAHLQTISSLLRLLVGVYEKQGEIVFAQLEIDAVASGAAGTKLDH